MILRKDNDYFLYLGNQLVFVEVVYVYSPMGTLYLLREICTSKAVLWLCWLVTGHLPVHVRFVMDKVALVQVFFFTVLFVSFCQCCVLMF
jgi:hypothetical protein